MLLIYAISSVISAFVAFVMIFRNKKHYYIASCISLLSLSLAILEEYLLVVRYVNKGDFSALEDVIPYTYQNITVCVWIMVIANLLMIILPLFVKKKRVK